MHNVDTPFTSCPSMFLSKPNEAASRAVVSSLRSSSWCIFISMVAGCFDHKSGIPEDLVEYSETNLRNMEDLSSNSRAGASNSATRPAKYMK